MTVLTIYFCGTGSTHVDNSNSDYWNGELVSTLAHNSQSLSHEFAEWIIIDGPGSGNLQNDELWEKSGNYWNIKGLIFGKGWEENVKHAIHIIKGDFNWQREKLTEKGYNHLKEAGVPIKDVEVTGSFFWRHYEYGKRQVTPQQLQQSKIKIFRKDGIIPTQVNLVGWSRGGISCHMLANAMLKDPALEKIPVNIFAIDPVPGILNFQQEKVSLGKNVREYVAFYARDERSKGFSCVIPETDPSTAVHIYPMAGRHATLVGNAGSGKALYEPGMIVRHFAEVCLTRWGAKLDKKLNLNNERLLGLHEAVEKNEGLYTKLHKESYVVITEDNKGERNVTRGHSRHGTNFSSIKGSPFSPTSGLTANFLKDKTIYDIIKSTK
ncbi:hypothetical protein [Photorhabdus bodei]|uniref:Uncharacterized protein n=1 Tax=Photorhabdus bodei TaxID=2029681 RepID=A0ABX0AGP3_9GAMM|nr:hypothetical protein [Photorhabdus bodei]NDK97906.1 hypothetical protein [Photorhabdus bodei]NDL02156.1 hypothetical protein [Photorhabdus bodei]NDL06230.1 hypothetical protein [Photorhabdus bodei]